MVCALQVSFAGERARQMHARLVQALSQQQQKNGLVYMLWMSLSDVFPDKPADAAGIKVTHTLILLALNPCWICGILGFQFVRVATTRLYRCRCVCCVQCRRLCRVFVGGGCGRERQR